MNPYLLILLYFILSSSLVAEELSIKFKTKLIEDQYSAKVWIRHPMIDEYQAKRKGIKVQYITHLTADIDNKVIYDVWMSPLISKSPFLKFKFKYFGKHNIINLNVFDNNNILEKRSFKLNSRGKLVKSEKVKKSISSKTDFSKKIWETSTVDNGIKELYGPYNNEFRKGINVLTSDNVFYERHPIAIRSNIDLESLAIYAQNYSSESLRALFIVPEDGIIDYQLPIKIVGKKCRENTDITVVGKDKEGNLYKTISSIMYCRCSHGCGRDGE
ncbi:MAG: hypothetical protein GQ531_07105 [Sulfurovum sp.]|nr:hypothetical protein [Sulfurovum sp.]